MKKRQFAVASLTVAVMLSFGMGAKVSAQTKPKPKTPTTAPKSAAKPPARTTKTVKRKPVVRARGQAAPTRDRIVEIQEALAREGFYSGTPSGKWDAPTTSAMSSFQTARGLTATGKLGALSLQKLGLGSEIAGKAAPIPAADTRPSVLKESDLNE